MSAHIKGHMSGRIYQDSLFIPLVSHNLIKERKMLKAILKKNGNINCEQLKLCNV